MTQKIAVLGLGIMGGGMARQLLAKGFEVRRMESKSGQGRSSG
jgi:3-hydroxyisobutyrate dehydrogenase-like beta-hydroxyacid dehydrogenase